jgi:proteic killer suppression protein
MKFRFDDRKLQALYQREEGAKKYPSEVVDAFFKRMASIEAAKNETDLRALKSARLEKLKRLKDRYSMRLNKQWRLILRFERDEDGNVVVVLEISDHYGD